MVRFSAAPLRVVCSVDSQNIGCGVGRCNSHPLAARRLFCSKLDVVQAVLSALTHGTGHAPPVPCLAAAISSWPLLFSLIKDKDLPAKISCLHPFLGRVEGSE